MAFRSDGSFLRPRARDQNASAVYSSAARSARFPGHRWSASALDHVADAGWDSVAGTDRRACESKRHIYFPRLLVTRLFTACRARRISFFSRPWRPGSSLRRAFVGRLGSPFSRLPCRRCLSRVGFSGRFFFSSFFLVSLFSGRLANRLRVFVLLGRVGVREMTARLNHPAEQAYQYPPQTGR